VGYRPVVDKQINNRITEEQKHLEFASVLLADERERERERERLEIPQDPEP
jgi:hypothetical protein